MPNLQYYRRYGGLFIYRKGFTFPEKAKTEWDIFGNAGDMIEIAGARPSCFGHFFSQQFYK